MKNLEEMGLLALGSRLKRLSEILFRQSDELYKSRGVNLQSRCFPLLQLLSTYETISVSHLAELMGQTHPAISQMSKKLESQGWLYHEIDAKDERRRLLALTPNGYELVDRLKPLWCSLETVMKRILETSSYGLLDNIQLIEREVEKMSLKERVERLERQQRSDLVEIIHYDSNYVEDFYRLNQQWLEKYFYVEAHDHEVLSDPESYIIAKGGFVLFARLEQKIIGTAALIVNDRGELELSKMSVDDEYQGLGIGEKLARAAINQFQATDFKVLYLESNRKLLPALNLYRKLGFVEKENPLEKSVYNRSDIYMVFEGKGSDS
ncbi:bifunctional helix-turn-helix transcriptional regulator/GNAT family N-acetyltransferase [Aliikangiella sp. IMCC44359]|uniref:bifunctional helix-turn-helix transcriptional regulator/GNAT family N-acetyltransferase n=1 Tax=Aliikangiella sp. IMCC44359 TaxID=3459125 RepID=UPI00403AB9E8